MMMAFLVTLLFASLQEKSKAQRRTAALFRCPGHLVSDLATRDHRITGRLHPKIDRATAVGETAATTTAVAIGWRAEFCSQVRVRRIGGVIGVSCDVSHHDATREASSTATLLLKDAVTYHKNYTVVGEVALEREGSSDQQDTRAGGSAAECEVAVYDGHLRRSRCA